MKSKVDEVIDALDGKKVDKFCIDCKYFKKKHFYSKKTEAYCSHPISRSEHAPANYVVIGGKNRVDYQSCIGMRMSHNRCGDDAKLFEKK